MKLLDVIQSRCGDYFTPHFHSLDDAMNYNHFRKLSKENFFLSLETSSTYCWKTMVGMYCDISHELTEKEKADVLEFFDMYSKTLAQLDKLTLLYKPIGKANDP